MGIPKKPVSKEEALNRLASLCSRSEQCEFEVNRKMINWGIPSAQRREVTEYLKENRYVDDLRYARSFATDKARFSSWGPYKIRLELIRRRIPAPAIKEAVNNVDAQIWKNSLIKCAESKCRNLPLIGEDGWNNRLKLHRYLISRGFPSEAASKAVALMKKRQEESK